MKRRLSALRWLLLLAPLLLIAAKCIDNETLYRDSSGDWHVVGELHNDTGVSGAGMLLGGTLYDDAGNVLDTARTGACPMELPPHSFTAFDMHFNYSAAARPARYDIRPVDGRALKDPLPDSGLSLNGFKAQWSDKGVSISGSVHSTHAYTRPLVGCAALYNAAGKVVTHFTLINFGLTLPLNAGTSQPVAFTLPPTLVEHDATSLRLWLAGDSDVPFESDFAFTMTGSIPITGTAPGAAPGPGSGPIGGYSTNP
jgi:hypothetical protein